MEFKFLESLEVILIASALVVLILHRIKVPALVGFLIAGFIIGPHGTGMIKDTHLVELLAEVGVILLLFTIGIEFSMAKLMKIKKAVIGGGGVQVLFTICLSAIVACLLIHDIKKSIFIGFLIALSSTAIVMKMLAETSETDSPHGRLMVGILIFQDICVVPLMLLAPVLSGESINVMDIAIKMGKAILIIAVVVLSAKWIVPRLLHQVVHTRSRELFTITIILLCLGIAILTSKFGLSLALGAFLAGLIISESEYSHQAMSDILPFKDSFIGLFFVSVGMLINIGYITNNYIKIVIAVSFIFCIKLITGTLSALIIRSPLRTSIHTGLGLAQVGEFSFVLAVAGKMLNLITEDFYQIFLSSSIVTMIMTPFVLKTAPSISSWIGSKHIFKRFDIFKELTEKEQYHTKKHGHVIIIGFGLNGRNLARVLKGAEVPYVVLEMNSDTVKEMKKKGEPIYYGDGTSKEILHKLNITTARLLVIAISDPISTRSIVAIARKENPDMYIIVRTRYIAELDELKKLGANEVIPEEFETSVEIFSRVLHYYHIPRNVINEYIDDIRKNNYRMLRTVELPRKSLAERHKFLKEIDTETYLIKEDSPVDGYSIKEIGLRTKTGATIIAVQRGDKIHHNPSPDFVLKKNDIILFIGTREDIGHAIEYIESDKFLPVKYH
ncbi:MAG: monovalent cation:proton antiporter-2 (CPA2) family protein [Nitrospirota bacterium]